MATTQVGVAAHIIKRPRLTKILDETEARIILLCAPAGYGKTTLAREWVATRDEPVLWYSGGPAMADVAAFACDLADLFTQGNGEAEGVRYVAAAGSSPSLLARAVARLAPSGALVVIDDYHHATSFDSDQFFRGLLGGTDFRLLVTSRSRPLWADARQVVYGNAELLGASALKFTEDEVDLVLRDSPPVRARADGWPVLIGLAALRGGSPVDDLFDPAEMYDYFAHELYATSTATLRSSVLLLAAGGLSNEQAARDILGPDYSAAIAEAIDAGFVVREGEAWIAMHPLLRDFLLRQIAALPERDRSELVESVLSSLKAHAAWDEALELLEAVPTERETVDSLRAAFQDLLDSGRTETLRRWCELAARAGYENPIFLLAEAQVAMREGRHRDASALARTAARSLEGSDAALAHLTAARAAHLDDRHDDCLEDCRDAKALTTDNSLAGEATWIQFVVTWECAPAAIGPLYEELKTFADGSTDSAVRLATATAHVLLETPGRGVRAARNAITEATALLPRTRDPLIKTGFLNIYSYVLLLSGDYEAARAWSDALLEEAEKSGLEFVIPHALLVKGRSLVGMRRFSEASGVLREIAGTDEEDQPHIVLNTAMASASLRIAAGDLDGAVLLLQRSTESAVQSLKSEVAAWIALIKAAQRDQTATHYLSTVDHSYREASATAVLAEAILALDANPSRSAAVLDRLLARGDADPVVHACRACPDLARAAVAHGGESRVKELFTASRDLDLARRVGVAIPRELRRREGLTVREREVFDLMRQGHTNRQIARALFISESTAKVHVKHILEKLGVRSRVEAVAIAAEAD